MGNCIYVRSPSPVRVEGPELRYLRSEVWADPAEAGRILGAGHFLNTTAGIWFYEGELINDREALCARLRAMADLVESGEAARLYAAAKAKEHRADRRRGET